MTVPIEQMRRILIFGEKPEMMTIAVYSAAALVVALCGYIWFEKTRKGFADVL
jgi:lipopolysaccharide transport system permease protein